MYFQTHFKKAYLCIVSVCLALLAAMAAYKGLTRAEKTSADDGVCRVPVIMYHSVCINRNVKSDYVITPESFRRDIEYLVFHGCNFVSLGEVYNYYTGAGALPENPVALTFDDGFLNNLTAVLPVLRQFDIKANINVVGSYTEKYSAADDRNAAYACLTWDDIKTLDESGLVEIGSHTWDMHALGSRKGCAKKKGESDEDYAAALKADVERLNRALEENCGITPFVFAYPYGEISVGSDETLAAEGFKVLLTCEEKINTVVKGGGELLVLGRFNRASSLSTEEFMRELEY